ncbi:MAG: YggT family protein [Pseudomonadota bacterium]|nr:YggT family protein [Pseudomonadota bacterium]
MLFQIVYFLLDVAVTLVGGACLLRCYMHWRAMPMHHPVGQFVLALTDWLVRPLKKVLPSSRRLDVASFTAAWLLKLVQFLVLMAFAGISSWALAPLLALLGVARLAVSVATAVIVVTAILSWLGSPSLVRDMLARLCEPLLAPIRRVLPLVGRVDLSPLVAVVGLQVVSMVLGSWQGRLLGGALSMPTVFG